MIANQNQQPIIQIKKVKKSHEHHGGAWKMAYADFVTTMMSLFLVLWLANISTKKTTSTRQECKVHRPSLKLYAMYASYPHSHTANHAEALHRRSAQYDHVHNKPIKKACTKSTLAHIVHNLERQLNGYATLVATDSGFRIDMLNTNEGMFYRNSSTLTVRGVEVLEKVAEALQKIPNAFEITGFADKDFSSTKLALNRARTTEQFFQEKGIPQLQVQKISGEACCAEDCDGLSGNENTNARYNTVSIVLLD